MLLPLVKKEVREHLPIFEIGLAASTILAVLYAVPPGYRFSPYDWGSSDLRELALFRPRSVWPPR